MSALELLRYLTQIPFLIIFVVVGVQALRQPRRTNIDVALFFGVFALIFMTTWVQDLLAAEELPRLLLFNLLVLLMAMPYILLRLVADFAGAPAWLLRAAEAGLAVIAVSLWFAEDPYPGWYVLALVMYWVSIQLYVTVRFVRAAVAVRGVARRRKQWIAAGTFGLAVTLVLAGVRTVAPGADAFWDSASQVSTLLSGVAYLVGFATPAWLRRGWQAPDFREFLAESQSLAQLSDVRTLAAEIERRVAASVGSDGAGLVLWDEGRQRLLAPSYPDEDMPQGGRSLVERVYQTQKPRASLDTARDYPEFADEVERYGSRVLLGAPVSTAERRFGVLTAFSRQAGLFEDEDLELLVLIARQVALQLWSRDWMQRAAELSAREEANRMKEDFLSAAAHDLKTPLTTLLGQTQLMSRRAAREPERPPDPEGLQRMTREALRMRSLIDGLLDASRPGEGRFVQDRHPVDLLGLVREVVAERGDMETHRFRVEGDGECVASVDEARIRQVLQNLLDNAVKYSPQGGEVIVGCSRQADAVELSVADQGIGINEAELPYVFERFYRSTEADERKYGGMGLGLYLVDRIVGEHGGDVRVRSKPGQGSTFTVRIPIAQEGAQ